MEGYVQVYDAESEVDAALFRQRLEEAGIPVLEQPSGNPATNNVIYRLPPLRVALFVSPEDAERARSIADSYQREAREAPAGAEAAETTPEGHFFTKKRLWFRIGILWLWLVLALMIASLVWAAVAMLHGLFRLPR